MDEFALQWNNYNENFKIGFQNLFDRGELVDVSLGTCEGKIIKAHKTILSICSPYFQELFLTNPCKHPIVILKDVSFSIMSELLQFMYQGEVNVRHKDLQNFMRVAESLQIKGLTTQAPSNTRNEEPTYSQNNHHHHHQNYNQRVQNLSNPSPLNSIYSSTSSGDSKMNYNSVNKHNEIPSTSQYAGHKRHLEQPTTNNNSSNNIEINSRKQRRYSTKSDMNDNDVSVSDVENASSDDVFISPQISINESRFDQMDVKREGNDISSAHSHSQSPTTLLRSTFAGTSGNSFTNHGIPYNYGEYSGDLQAKNNDYNKTSPHMEIPAVVPGERWYQGKLQFMLSQRGKPLLVHDGHSFGIQYIRKDKKYWQCNLSRKYNCKARVTTTDAGEIIVTNNEHCHTEIRQHLRKDYKLNKLNRLNRTIDLRNISYPLFPLPTPIITTTTTSIIRGASTLSQSINKKFYPEVTRASSMSPIASHPLPLRASTPNSTPTNYSQSMLETNQSNNNNININNNNGSFDINQNHENTQN